MLCFRKRKQNQYEEKANNVNFLWFGPSLLCEQQQAQDYWWQKCLSRNQFYLFCWGGSGAWDRCLYYSVCCSSLFSYVSFCIINDFFLNCLLLGYISGLSMIYTWRLGKTCQNICSFNKYLLSLF